MKRSRVPYRRTTGWWNEAAANKLQEFTDSSGLSKEDFAFKIADAEPRTLYNWLNAAVAPTPKKLAHMCQKLGVPLSVFLDAAAGTLRLDASSPSNDRTIDQRRVGSTQSRHAISAHNHNRNEVPDLLTPVSSPADRGEQLVRMFGEQAGRTLVGLSQRAIAAIEHGRFEEYVDIGHAIQLAGQEIGSQDLTDDGTSLAADGHRLLAGLNPYDTSRLLALAKDGFQDILQRTPNNHRALRGLATCVEAEFDFGSALKQLDRAIEGLGRRLDVPSRRREADSRTLADRHEFLRLIRHRIDVILRIKASSSQSYWNSEVGMHALARLVDEHNRLFEVTMHDLAASPDWFHFECFAGLTFLADGAFELGDVTKGTQHALAALEHRRATMTSRPTSIQLANLNWWLKTCREGRLAHKALANRVERLAEAARGRTGIDVLSEVDRVLALRARV